MYLDFFNDIFFPPACLGCSSEIAHGVLCERCKHTIELFNTLFCGTCNARLPELRKICHRDAPYMLGTAARYDDAPVQKLIHALKFMGIQSAAVPLSSLLIEYVAGLNMPLDRFCVVPIPLSLKRHRSRGFNQSRLIAQPFARHFSVPLQEDLLVRTLHTKPQSKTDDILERKENIHGCFALARPLSDGETKNVILVDDVTTSGTTFLEAARVLKEGGAKRIIALAVARA